MSNEKAITILSVILNDYKANVIEGESERPNEDAKEALKENKACVEALRLATRAIKKQIPKKCVYGNGFYPCPNCDKATVEDYNWCSGCGQAIIH